MKKLIKFAAICVMSSALMTGCKSDFTTITQGADYRVVAMKDTGVLYYKGSYMMTPYINENGKFCKIANGKIVEIDDEKEVENDGN